ncbi:MAG: hypothetical protein IJ179_11260 [Oscillospiraceae bacterium]|nr:hypothetical protein [Oscillospiraceae bacterium]MBQ9250929.1 hypothetical protein [Oscillospiraceae bacterium]
MKRKRQKKTLSLFLLLLSILLCGCAARPGGEEVETDKFLQQALAVAASYRDLCAEDTCDIPAVLARLDEKGISAVDVAGRFPFVNPEPVELFFKVPPSDAEAAIDFVRICQDGGLIDTVLIRSAGEDRCRIIRIAWQEGKAAVTYDLEYPLTRLTLTDKGYLIFTCDIPDNTAESDHDGYIEPTAMIRLKPLDEPCRAWTEKLTALGYRGHDLFTADWTAGDLSAVELNELFPALYRAETGTLLAYYDNPWPMEEQRDITLVPADIFEDLLLQYLDVTREAVRAAADYDAEADAYPVPIQSLHGPGENPLPEVTAIQDNADGTVTLTIDALSVEQATDRAFTHLLTLRLCEDGRYRFISNEVLRRNGAA